MIKVDVNYKPSVYKELRRDGYLKMEELLHDLKASVRSIHITHKKLDDKPDLFVDGELVWCKSGPIFRPTRKSGPCRISFKTGLGAYTSSDGYSHFSQVLYEHEHSREERKEIAKKVLELYEKIKSNFSGDSKFLPPELKDIEENTERFYIGYQSRWYIGLYYKNENRIIIHFPGDDIKAEVNMPMYYIHKPKLKLGKIQGERFTLQENRHNQNKSHLVVFVNQGESIDEIIAKCLEDLRKEVNVHLTLKPSKKIHSLLR